MESDDAVDKDSRLEDNELVRHAEVKLDEGEVEKAVLNNTSSEMSSKVMEAINGITADPSKLGDIVDSIKGNKEVYREVMKYINENPSIKDKAMNSIMGSTPSRAEIEKMSLKDKKELLKKAREAKREIDSIDPKVIDAVKINMSRKVTQTKISAVFPSGTKFSEGGISKELKKGLCVIYMTNEGGKNKLTSKLIGEPVFGDAIFYKEDSDGNIANLTIDEMRDVFPSLKCS